MYCDYCEFLIIGKITLCGMACKGKTAKMVEFYLCSKCFECLKTDKKENIFNKVYHVPQNRNEIEMKAI